VESVKFIDGSSPEEFLHFVGLKIRFFRVPKPAVSWTPSILQLIFFPFWRLENSVLPSRETQVSRLPSIVWANFTHFAILKMWFLTIRETNNPRYLAMSGNFLNFWGLKMRIAQSFQGYQVSCERIFRVTKSPAFWQPEYAISADSWNQSFKVPRKEWKIS